MLQIEVAYDALLMRSMKARLSGELRPSRDVQFADVRKYRPAAPRVKLCLGKGLCYCPAFDLLTG